MNWQKNNSCIKKETLISQFSENARTTIKTNFSYEAVSKKWIELIDEKQIENKVLYIFKSINIKCLFNLQSVQIY